jgi:hypothetical protein
MAFALPPKSQVGYLDPSIAGEGVSAMQHANRSPIRPVVPDWSVVKPIQHYFWPKDHQAWPAWVFHKSTPDQRIVDQKEAEELGLVWRATTPDERAKYRQNFIWEWTDECDWRPEPGPQHLKPNPYSTGKIYEPPRNTGPSTADLVAALTKALSDKLQPSQSSNEAIAVAVATAMKMMSEAKPALDKPETASDGNALNDSGMSADQEKDLWIEEAESRGIKIDKRWGVSKIKEAVEKAA